MVTVADESPFVAVVSDVHLEDTCSSCFTQCTSLQVCKSCKVIGYCNTICAVDDIDYHEDECRFLKLATGKYPKFLESSESRRRNYEVPHENTRIMGRLVLKLREKDYYYAFNGRQYKDMEDHLDDFRKDPERRQFLEKEYKKVVAYMRSKANQLPDSDSLYSHLAKFHTNRTFILAPTYMNSILGVAIYVGLAAQPHSCHPDAYIIYDGPKARLRVLDAKGKYSEKLTVSYAMSIFTTEKRREQLKKTRFIDCKCIDCRNTKREVLCYSGRSHCCPEGYVPAGSHNETLHCAKCKKKSPLTYLKIMTTNKKLEKYMTKDYPALVGDREIDDYWPLVDEAEKVLSPYNLFMANFAHFLSYLAWTKRDFAYMLRFSLWRRKAVDTLLPIGDQAIYYEQLAKILQMTLSPENKEKKEWKLIMEVGMKAKKLVELVYGPDHTRTVDCKDALESVTLAFKMEKMSIQKK